MEKVGVTSLKMSEFCYNNNQNNNENFVNEINKPFLQNDQ